MTACKTLIAYVDTFGNCMDSPQKKKNTVLAEYEQIYIDSGQWNTNTLRGMTGEI